MCILYTILYYIRGSDLCAATVQLYHTYSLYYLVLRFSSDLCAVYLYYFYAPTQIIRALASLTHFLPNTASHIPPELEQYHCLLKGGGPWEVVAGTN